MKELFEFDFKIAYILYEGRDDFKIVQTSKKFLKFNHKEDERDDINRVSISGIMTNVRDGDFIHAYGSWEYSKKYGWGIKAEGCTLEIPSNITGIKQFLCRFCRGIGERTAQQIVDKFGEDSIAVITNESMRLTELPRISEKKANIIHKAILKHKSMEDLSVFLFSHGCSSYNEVLSIYKSMGERALDKIMTNPYSICREVGSSKFPLADRIALSSGYDENSKERLKNIITFFLSYKENGFGDMFAWMKQLPSHIAQYLHKNGAPLSEILYNSEQFSECLMELQRENIIVLAETDEDYCVYLKRNYELEIDLSKLIADMSFKSPATPYTKFDDFVAEFQNNNRITFTDKQIEAIKKAMTYRLSLVTGGAGTGKTETVRGIMACIRHKDKDSDIALISPTGRASKRMTEVTGEQAMTIHRFLKINPENPFGSEEEIPEADYIICDEASMIDAKLIFILIKAVSKTNAHLIFVGDVNQLAPVGAGLPFKDMLYSNTIPTIVLSTLFRQEEQSLINVNANKVLVGDPNIQVYPNRTDFNFFQLQTQDDIKQYMLRCFDGLMCNMGYTPKDIIVLSPMNKTLLGVTELNNFLQPYFNKRGIEHGASFHSMSYTIYENDRVMQIANNYDLNVFNGDIGYVRSINRDDGEIIVEFDDVDLIDGKAVPTKRLVTYDMDNAEEQDLVLSYACTVHKAQGCEFPVVFMPVNSMLINLSRTLIYTALTRARDCFAFCGDYSALYKGIQKDEILKRNTQLKNYLVSLHNEESKS